MQVLLYRYEPLEHDVQLVASALHVAQVLLHETQEITPVWFKMNVPFGQRPRH